MNKFKKTRNPGDWEHYRKLRNAMKSRLKTTYFELMCWGHSNQSCKVWRELSTVLGHKARTRTPHLSTSSVTIDSPQVIASMLNSHFTTPVSSPSPDLDPPTVHSADTVFGFRPVDEEEVMQALWG